MHGLVERSYDRLAFASAVSPHVDHAPTPAGAVDRECIERFMAGLSAALAVDGLLVACHSIEDSPILLFSDGDCQCGTEIERILLRNAVESCEAMTRQSDMVSRLENHPAGTVFTATLLLRNLAITLTSLLRDERSGPPAVVRERLAGLLPIASPFFSMWLQRKDIAHRVSGLEAALDSSDNGTLLLDRAGHLLFANRSGKEFLTSRRGLAAEHGRLTLSSLTETFRLNAAIEHLCSQNRIDKGTTPVLVVQRRHMRPLMITLAVADADHDEHEEPLIIARLFDPERDLAEVIAPACRFYGLSPSETRLTRSIAEGRTLAGAAAELGVREQTARSYLKQIFLKTETNRQAELVALMLRSAVRLAPRCRTQVF